MLRQHFRFASSLILTAIRQNSAWSIRWTETHPIQTTLLISIKKIPSWTLLVSSSATLTKRATDRTQPLICPCCRSCSALLKLHWAQYLKLNLEEMLYKARWSPIKSIFAKASKIQMNLWSVCITRWWAKSTPIVAYWTRSNLAWNLWERLKSLRMWTQCRASASVVLHLVRVRWELKSYPNTWLRCCSPMIHLHQYHEAKNSTIS